MGRIHRIAVKVLLATDRSMALTLRERMIDSISAVLPPAYMESKLYDTREDGKGYADGYVSFGLRPTDFNRHGLIGGILIAGVFDTGHVKSTSPERDDPKWKSWYDAGGNEDVAGVTTTMAMAASYYHKREGGGRDKVLMTNDAGDAEFSFDRYEGIHFFELMDPATTGTAITSLVNEVIKNPPEGSLSQSKAVQRRVSPYSTKMKALKYLSEAGRNSISKREVMEINRWTSELPLKIIDWFKKRGYVYTG